jgi:ribosomal protein L37E
MPERKSLMPKGGTSIDLAAAPLHWMCHGCGESFAEKPERCSHCCGTAFERVGGETYLQDIAEAVARAMGKETITREELCAVDETIITRGKKPNLFGPEDLERKIRSAEERQVVQMTLTIHQARQVLGWLQRSGREAS